MGKTRELLVHAATEAAWSVLKSQKGSLKNQHAARGVPRHALELAKAKAWIAVERADSTAGTSHHASVRNSGAIADVVKDAVHAAFELWKAKRLAEQAGARF